VSDSKETSDEDASLAELMQECNEANTRGDVKRAEALSLQIMAAIMSKKDQKPSPWLACVTEAAAHEDRHEWSEAERCYRAALDVAIQEGRDMEYKAHSDLAGFLSLMGREEEALAEARLAERATLQSMAVLRRRCLHALAAYERDAGNWERARELVDEIMTTDALLQDRVGYAGALVSRAHCHTHGGDVNSAEADLNEAWKILEPYQASSIMAGHHGALARWWCVKSEHLRLAGDLNGERDAARRSLEHTRILANATQVKRSIRLSSLEESLKRYGEALDSAAWASEREAVERELSDVRVMLYGPTKAPPRSMAH